MKLRISYILILLLMCAKSFAGKGFVAHKGEVQGSYNFWFYDPEEQHDPRAHFPLLIFLHGRSLCGTNLDRVKRYGPIHAVAKGAYIDSYIMAPQNPGGAWNPDKLMKIVEWAKEHYAIDESRIYVYGMSLGGYGTIDFVAAYPDKIASAMAICGGASAKNLDGLSKVPLWIVHGTADRAVPIAQSDKVAAAIKATGDDSRLIYTRLKGVDHGRPARLFYMNQTYDWLFSHSLNDEGRPVNRDFEITLDLLNSAYQDLGKEEPIDEESYK
ncbi:MAG: dienelactone hydrolase family protein [Bacteroidaceae bacterium]|nr:dienelactone hydrolase family protein [Bacteroidaceae bacterium]